MTDDIRSVVGNADGESSIRAIGLNSVADSNVKDQIAMGTFELRKELSQQIIKIFKLSNLFILVMIGLVFFSDCLFLKWDLIKPENRLVNGQVLMAVIGATTVQLGAVMYLMAKYLFAPELGTSPE
ncbi:MAG: hypothetical protein WCF85_11835 [Rhodospirillaceae bacterium]